MDTKWPKHLLTPPTLQVRRHCQWRGTVLRRNTGVPPHEDRAPASMHSGSGRGCAKGRGAAQAQHVPGAREGRPAKAAGARLGDRGPLERNSAALRSRSRPPPSSPRTARSASRRVLWVGATLVGSPVCRGPARRCKHSLGALVASRPSANAKRRPSTGSCARPRR